MLHLENPINIIIGGYFEGDCHWGNRHAKSDNCYKLYYLTRGSLWVEGEQGRVELRCGGLYLINGYKVKGYGSECAFETHWLHFTPQNLAINRALYSLAAVVELPQQTLSLAIAGGVYGERSNICSHNAFSIELQLTLHYHILSVVMEALKGYEWESDSNGKRDERVNIVIDYIHNNYRESISLEDMAAVCNLSPNHLHKIFTATLHTTPANYVTQVKMNHALLLISQGRTIKEISYDLGYCNDAHFSRTFKRYYGFPPKIYRSSELLSNEFATQLSQYINQ